MRAEIAAFPLTVLLASAALAHDAEPESLADLGEVPDSIEETRDPRGPVTAEELARGNISVPGEPVHDNEFRVLGMFDRLEYQSREGTPTYVWDAFGYAGGDYNRLWIESEGEGGFNGPLESADLQVLYSRAITAYWNVQVGARRTFGAGPSRWYAVLAAEGLNIYWSQIEADAYLSEKGDLSGAFEVEYDAMLTQRLVAQPRFEVGLQAQDVPELGVGAGFTTVEAGLRVRYEIVREFAPYVGVSWVQKVGETAAMLPAGKSSSAVSAVAGVRMWF
jgi:copper resistance protein B